MEARGELGGVRRDPRITITGRACVLCKGNAALALVLNFQGAFGGQLHLCVNCVLRVANKLASREDAILNLEIGSNRVEVYNLGQNRQN